MLACVSGSVDWTAPPPRRCVQWEPALRYEVPILGGQKERARETKEESGVYVIEIRARARETERQRQREAERALVIAAISLPPYA